MATTITSVTKNSAVDPLKVALYTLFLFLASSTHAFGQAQPLPVMVYAIANESVCGSESSVGYGTAMASSKTYNQARSDLQANMAQRYSRARVRAGSSKFEFGDNAGGVAIVQWQTGSGKCTRNVIAVHFGIDDADAMRRARQSAPANHKILLHRYFARVTSR
jgi:hypothetical protein